MADFDEKRVLAYNPFEGDFGGSSRRDRILSDKIVTARKPAQCHYCLGAVVPGTRIRRRAEIFDGDLLGFAWCSECCEAMALSWEDAGEKLTSRFRLRDVVPSCEAC